MEKSKFSKLEISYNNGKVKIELSENAKKLLLSLSLTESRLSECYFLGNYENRYLIKGALKQILNPNSLIFFNPALLTMEDAFCSHVGCIHEFERIKTTLEKDFKKIVKFYLEENNNRGGQNGV